MSNEKLVERIEITKELIRCVCPASVVDPIIEKLDEAKAALMNDTKILELSIEKLSAAFDNYIGECLDDNEKPKMPTIQAIMKAKGYLPPKCKHAFKKKEHFQPTPQVK